MGVLFIITRKLPALKALPLNGTTGIKKYKIVENAEEKVMGFFTYFEKQILLHKVLSWVKVMTLKIETRVDGLLHNLRRRAQQVDKNIKNKK